MILGPGVAHGTRQLLNLVVFVKVFFFFFFFFYLRSARFTRHG